MADVVTGTGESQPAEDTIRSALAAAVAAQDAPVEAEKPAKPVADKAPEPEKPEVDEPDAKPEPEGDAAPAEPTDKDATDKKDEGDEPAETEKKAAEAPASWSAADKEMFKAQPPAAQEFLARRYKEMEAGFTKKTQAIAQLKTEYEPVDQLFIPYKETMKQKGFTPRTLIEAWANVEKELASGEDRAVKVVQGLVSGYKIPLSKVAAALGIKAGAQETAPQPGADGTPPAPDGQATQLPPELSQRLQGLEQRLQQDEQRRAQEAQQRIAEQESRVMSEIEKFKSATDEKGTLLRPHFEDVEADMTALANAAKLMGQPVPALQALYETAVRANPSTYAKLRAAEQQAADSKRAADARAKAAAAKKAAASVTGAPGAGQAPSGRTASDRSIREELEAAADELVD